MIFGLVNAIIKPIVQIISIPLYILTLGLIHIVINALMLWITSWITEHTTHWGLYHRRLLVDGDLGGDRAVDRELAVVARGRRAERSAPDRHTGDMPELPEIEALADHLRRHAVGLTIGRIDVSAFSVLKTFDPAISVLHGQTVTGANRWGKYLGMQVGRPAPDHPPVAGGLAAVVGQACGGAAETRQGADRAAGAPREAGGGTGIRSHRGRHAEAAGGLAGRRPGQGAGHRRARPRRAVAGPRRAGRRAGGQQRADQDRHHRSEGDRGIGNAYSDEILHVAKISPFATAGKLTDAQLAALHDAMISVLTDAVARSVGQGAATLKGEKRSGLRVHARTGMPCPVCGDTVREVSFADKSFQYCPTCQTGGKVLADRRMSRLLK